MWPRSWLKGQGSELGMQVDGTGPRQVSNTAMRWAVHSRDEDVPWMYWCTSDHPCQIVVILISEEQVRGG